MKIRLLLSGFGLLATLSHQTLAQSQLTLEPLAIRSMRGCSGTQEHVLRNAEADLLSRIQTVRSELPKFDLRYVYENFIVPGEREWSENSLANQRYSRYLFDMNRVFTLMENDTRSGLNFECKDSMRERHCRNGEVYAYVLFLFGSPRKTIYFCGEFFRMGFDQQKETLLHELSHYSAATEDLVGNWSGGKQTDITQAPKDAYHIGYFMNGDTELTLKRQIWLWNWKRKPFPTEQPALQD